MGSIALYGNFISDKIFQVKNGKILAGPINRGGGIYNVRRAIKNNDVYMSHLPSFADAYVFESEDETTSYVEWDNCNREVEPLEGEYDHAHIAYIDRIKNPKELIDAIKKNTKTISIDVALDKVDFEFGKVFNTISHKIDYLFCNEAQVELLYNSGAKIFFDGNKPITPNLTWIAHSKDKILHMYMEDGLDKGWMISNIEPPLENVNTVGAGDMLAGFFIDHMVSGDTDWKAIEKAQKEVYEWLKTQKY